jgi:glycosyltransferase involved in cell wall biosynthesis
MRVAWVIDGRLDQVSGGYLYDRLIVDHLRRQDVTVEVVSLPAGAYGARLARGLWSDVAERVAAAAPEVVVQDELSHPALLRANRRLARSHPGLPRLALVHHLRSSEPRSPLSNFFYRAVERSYLSSVDGLIFNSRATRESVHRLRLPPVPAAVAVPGADRLGGSIEAEAIGSRARQPGPLRILFLGNLIPRKGLVTLIEAVALLPTGSARLEVAGSAEADPAYARQARRRVERLRLQDVVRFRGVLDGDDLARAMREAHVLAVPSSYEGYGMAYLEGMGCGLLPIAGSNGGASEFIRHGENGFLVDGRDPAGLALLLASLHSDRPRLARLGMAARATYAAHPTWEQTGAVIHAFLAGLVRQA